MVGGTSLIFVKEIQQKLNFFFIIKFLYIFVDMHLK